MGNLRLPPCPLPIFSHRQPQARPGAGCDMLISQLQVAFQENCPAKRSVHLSRKFQLDIAQNVRSVLAFWWFDFVQVMKKSPPSCLGGFLASASQRSICYVIHLSASILKSAAIWRLLSVYTYSTKQ